MFVIDDNSLILIDEINQSQLVIYDDTLVLTHQQETDFVQRELIKLVSNITGLSCDGNSGPKEEFIIAPGVGNFTDLLLTSLQDYIKNKHKAKAPNESRSLIEEQDRAFRESLEQDILKEETAQAKIMAEAKSAKIKAEQEAEAEEEERNRQKWMTMTPAERRALILASYEQRSIFPKLPNS